MKKNPVQPRGHRLLQVLAAVGLFVFAPTVVADEYHAYLGSLHGHTSYSDGSGLPDEAFARARSQGDCDFFTITEHNHSTQIKPKEPRVGQLPIGGAPSLYDGPSAASVVNAAKAATHDGQFVALYGQEFSTISSGNHMGVLDTAGVIKVPAGQFDKLLEWIGMPAHHDSQGQIPILQLNHPSSNLRKQGIEYGADDFPSSKAWIQAIGARACTIEILNGPGLSKTDKQPVPRPFEADYRYYLSRGFRLAPTGDQDNHYRTWGTLTSVRTGIIAKHLTKKDLLNAIRDRHVFATTDQNLRVIGRMNSHLFGDIIEPPPEGSRLDIQLSITDSNEPNANYTVQVFDGDVGASPATAGRSEELTNVGGLYHVSGPEYRGPSQYVFIRIKQKNHSGPDDVVWTAPVWFANPLSLVENE